MDSAWKHETEKLLIFFSEGIKIKQISCWKMGSLIIKMLKEHMKKGRNLHKHKIKKSFYFAPQTF